MLKLIRIWNIPLTVDKSVIASRCHLMNDFNYIFDSDVMLCQSVKESRKVIVWIHKRIEFCQITYHSGHFGKVHPIVPVEIIDLKRTNEEMEENTTNFGSWMISSSFLLDILFALQTVTIGNFKGSCVTTVGSRVIKMEESFHLYHSR